MAAKHRNTLMVGLLLKANADPLPRNASGEQAVDIAVANKDADIVTMLRMAGARQEMYQLPSFSDSEPRGGGCRKKSTLRRTIDDITMRMTPESSNGFKSDSSEDDVDSKRLSRSLGSLLLKSEAKGDPPKIPPKKPQRKSRLSLAIGHRRSRSDVPSESVTISKAMFNYGGPGEEHCLEKHNIPMAKGEKFEVIRADHKGWTKVRRVLSDGRGKEGYVPTDYLKEISTDDS